MVGYVIRITDKNTYYGKQYFYPNIEDAIVFKKRSSAMAIVTNFRKYIKEPNGKYEVLEVNVTTVLV